MLCPRLRRVTSHRLGRLVQTPIEVVIVGPRLLECPSRLIPGLVMQQKEVLAARGRMRD
jgi:hypothetical protein